jgi:hypothetical protein
VQEHHIRPQRAERVFQRPRAERDAVAVGGHDAQRRQLVAAGRVALLGAGDQDVVVDLAGADRVLGLGVEVGADAAAALAVEERDVGNAQRLGRDGAPGRPDARGAAFEDRQLRRHDGPPRAR